jgi:hypothetical protein
MRPLRPLPFRGHHGGRRLGGEKEAEKLLGSSGYPHILIGVAAALPSHQPPTAISVPAFEALYSTLLLDYYSLHQPTKIRSGVDAFSLQLKMAKAVFFCP